MCEHFCTKLVRLHQTRTKFYLPLIKLHILNVNYTENCYNWLSCYLNLVNIILSTHQNTLNNSGKRAGNLHKRRAMIHVANLKQVRIWGAG